MTLRSFPGLGVWLPELFPGDLVPAFTSITLDAAADRITYIGRFQHKDHAAKTVDGVGFLLGAVSKGAGSTLSVSLQDVDSTAGPPMREDGTVDQQKLIANADAGFTSNVWYEAAFDSSATRSLTPGDMVAVVFKFGSFVASDTVAIRGLTGAKGAMMPSGSLVVANLTGSYAAQVVLPNVVLRCTDGTYGTLSGAWPCFAIQTSTLAVNATPDEYAIGVQVPFPCTVDALWCLAALTTATDSTELLLYSGTTALATVTVNHRYAYSATGRPLAFPLPTPVALAANTLYRVAMRPLGTNNVSYYWLTVQTAAHWQCYAGGVLFDSWNRVDQGAWGSEAPTERPFLGVRLSAFDDGASGRLLNGGRLLG